MAVPPVSTTISHSPRSLRDLTRREDRHLKFYELRDNLAYRTSPTLGTSLLTEIAVVTLIVGGGGLYWLVPALILALVGGMLNAWLLLVRLPSDP